MVIGATLGVALGAMQSLLLMMQCVLAVFLLPGYFVASALIYLIPSIELRGTFIQQPCSMGFSSHLPAHFLLRVALAENDPETR
jgi:hypothetical protein